MRIRSIKPEFWRSDDIAGLSIEDRLLFVGLWSYVDDNGVGRDQVALIVADLFAHDMEEDPRETFARVSRGLASLSDTGLIHRYEAGKHKLLEIVSWADHQRIDRPGKARYPRSSADSRHPREDASSPRVNVDPGSGIRDQGAGEQGSRGTGQSDQGSDSTDTTSPTSFHGQIVTNMGIELESVRDEIEKVLNYAATDSDIARLCAHIATGAKEKVGTGYVIKSIRNQKQAGKWRKVLAGEAVT